MQVKRYKYRLEGRLSYPRQPTLEGPLSGDSSLYSGVTLWNLSVVRRFENFWLGSDPHGAGADETPTALSPCIQQLKCVIYRNSIRALLDIGLKNVTSLLIALVSVHFPPAPDRKDLYFQTGFRAQSPELFGPAPRLPPLSQLLHNVFKLLSLIKTRSFCSLTKSDETSPTEKKPDQWLL